MPTAQRTQSIDITEITETADGELYAHLANGKRVQLGQRGQIGDRLRDEVTTLTIHGVLRAALRLARSSDAGLTNLAAFTGRTVTVTTTIEIA